MREYSFDVSGPLPAGRVAFRIVNAGHETHIPVLVALDDASPPIAERVRQSPLPVTLASLNPREPGKTGTFAVDLEPGGRYALICRAGAPDGVPHAFKDMTWEARAGEHRPPGGGG